MEQENTVKEMVLKIGNTIYDINFYFSKTSRETMNDKMLRIIRNDMNSRNTLPREKQY
jgi:hypothetical protein